MKWSIVIILLVLACGKVEKVNKPELRNMEAGMEAEKDTLNIALVSKEDFNIIRVRIIPTRVELSGGFSDNYWEIVRIYLYGKTSINCQDSLVYGIDYKIIDGNPDIIDFKEPERKRIEHKICSDYYEIMSWKTEMGGRDKYDKLVEINKRIAEIIDNGENRFITITFENGNPVEFDFTEPK